jgi:uncharacterized RDD family membrane protein YckC
MNDKTRYAGAPKRLLAFLIDSAAAILVVVWPLQLLRVQEGWASTLLVWAGYELTVHLVRVTFVWRFMRTPGMLLLGMWVAYGGEGSMSLGRAVLREAPLMAVVLAEIIYFIVRVKSLGMHSPSYQAAVSAMNQASQFNPLDYISNACYLIFFLTSFFSRERKTVFDYLANTTVIQE